MTVKRHPLTATRLDNICEAFANVVDAKSPLHLPALHRCRRKHPPLSPKQLGLSEARVHLVRRAALLTRRRQATRAEQHPRQKWTADRRRVVGNPANIRWSLEAFSAALVRFAKLAIVAAEHHEKLDGSGYPDGLRGEQMSLEARIIAVSDIFTAMVEKRPYPRSGGSTGSAEHHSARRTAQGWTAPVFDGLTALVDSGWALPAELAPDGVNVRVDPPNSGHSATDSNRDRGCRLGD